METITKMDHRSHNEEVNETVGAFVTEAEKYDFTADVYLEGVIASLKQENSLLTTAIKANMASSQKSNFDEQRYFAGRGLFFCTNAACLLPDERIVKAANLVRRVLDKYTTSIFRVSYAKETAFINSLIEDLEVLATEIDKVPQLGLHIDNLKQRQSDFIAAKDQYIDAKIEGKAVLSAYRQKNIVRKLMNDKLIPYLNLMSTFNPTTYGAITIKCAEIVGENNKYVKRRQTSSSEDEK